MMLVAQLVTCGQTTNAPWEYSQLVLNFCPQLRERLSLGWPNLVKHQNTPVPLRAY